MEAVQWADRGQSLQHGSNDTAQAGAIGVARSGSTQLAANAFSIWVQVRGKSWVEAKEGQFELHPGDWIALDRDSKPLLQASRHGVCIGLGLTADTLGEIEKLAGCSLYAGRGHVSRRYTGAILKLWRGLGQRLVHADGVEDAAADAAALRPLLLHLAGLQGELAKRISRCPGRSRVRQRQVFGRMQRAHLYLQGNCHRIVRLSELAELTSFSTWYLSKTFHGLYEESPQTAAARMRLDRAASLLRRSPLMIGEVAAMCGFDNCCSFARAFRARFGTSATRFRQAARDGAPTDSAKPVGFGRKAVAALGA